MKPISQFTQIEMAAYVQSLLEKEGIRVVLSGGAATAYYSANKYVSYDVDLVNVFSVPRQRILNGLTAHGFIEEGRYLRHPDSPNFIEFPQGPLTVGLEPVKSVEQTQLETGVLNIISATDSVKDRLAAFYHWGDEQCLFQALLICRACTVDMQEVRRWSDKEGKLREYERFAGEI